MGMMTIAQAAARLGMHPGALRKAIQQERIAVVRLSPRVILLEDDEVRRYANTARGKGGRPRKETPQG